jgi:hypothetical protein
VEVLGLHVQGENVSQQLSQAAGDFSGMRIKFESAGWAAWLHGFLSKMFLRRQRGVLSANVRPAKEYFWSYRARVEGRTTIVVGKPSFVMKGS